MRKRFEDMTTEELIEFYVYLNKEWQDEESKKHASYLIKKVLRKRFDNTIKMLDNWQTKENPHGTFKNILLGIY